MASLMAKNTVVASTSGGSPTSLAENGCSNGLAGTGANSGGTGAR
jgi:hypothetical protein